MEKLETLLEYSVDYIVNRLQDFNGESFPDVYELSNELTMHDNMSGSFTYSRYNAQQYIKEWFNELGDILEHYESQMGEPLKVNPFTDSEKFHAIVVMLKIEMLLSGLKCLNVDGDIVLNDQTIKAITDELETIKE
jgi:hypothetical protein